MNTIECPCCCEMNEYEDEEEFNCWNCEETIYPPILGEVKEREG